MIEKSVEILKKEISLGRTAERSLLVGFFAFVMFAGALIRIYIPFSPVPITMQTFVLFMAVYYLDPKEIGISQMLYISAGIIGIPVFAVGLAGAWALAGPTAGYLVGFAAAGYLMAYNKERAEKHGVAGMIVLFSAGIAVIYALGVAHLVAVYKLSLKNAVLAGILPFIAGDIIKIFAAAAFLKIKK